jgi:hypothetical protein
MTSGSPIRPQYYEFNNARSKRYESELGRSCRCCATWPAAGKVIERFTRATPITLVYLMEIK